MDQRAPDCPAALPGPGGPSHPLDELPERPPAGCGDRMLWRVSHALGLTHAPASGRCTSCREPFPCRFRVLAEEGLREASRIAGPSPRAFALCAEGQGEAAAYGLSLPDGSAVSVQWSSGRQGALGVWNSAAAAARLTAYRLVWLGAAGAGD